MTLQYRLFCGVALSVLYAGGEAFAQTTSPVADQMQQLQQQIQLLQQHLQTLQNQVNAQTQPQPTAAAAPGPHVTQSAGNRFSLESADGQYSVGLTAQFQIDAGGYAYHPNSKATVPHDLDSGVNSRRARIGLVGKLAGDWNYALVYDFGGSTDSGTGGINASGIEKGYVTYNGFNNGPIPLAFDLGYQDVPFTLDEATSSNDIMFMERASSQVIAANIAAGDFRSALGVRSNDDRYWAGVYVTGPTSGSNHANTTGGTGGNGEPLGAFGRVGFQALQAPDYSVHVGVDAAGLMKPSTTGGVRTITLSDRPELRIDPTSIITTPGAGTGGALGTVANPLSDAAVFGVELAGGYQNLFFQSEGFNYRIDRQGLPANTFWGGYVEGSWTVTGEHRNYVPAAGAYSGIVPAHPFSPSAGQWGAFELAARYSYIDLDDNIGSAAAAAATPVTTALKTNGVAGGRQQVWTLGVNWYPNSNLRFTLDYLHGVIDKPGTAAASVFSEAGANFDAFAMRTQFAF